MTDKGPEDSNLAHVTRRVTVRVAIPTRPAKDSPTGFLMEAVRLDDIERWIAFLRSHHDAPDDAEVQLRGGALEVGWDMSAQTLDARAEVERPAQDAPAVPR
jgi:hypothetical protein